MLLTLLLTTALAATSAPRFDAVQMMKLKRLGDPQLSPDGKWVAYQATDVALEAGTRNTDIWIVPAGSPEGAPRRLTDHAAPDTRPRWSPDGRHIAFESARDGASQIYVVPAAGGAAKKVTSLATEAGGVVWIDAARLLVRSDTYPACDTRQGLAVDDACQKKRLDEAGKPSSARVYDRLLYRHWDTWDDDRRTHLLVVPLDGGPVRDLTPGDRDVPPFSLGGADDYAVSPDGAEVCFARNDDSVEATSTNAELFVVPTRGGAAVKISGSPGYDGAPRYSPDGTMIAFRAQQRAGFEADRWRLMVYDRRLKATRSLSEGFDRQVESLAW